MVVFTCNNCGESLQKPKVEKHYSTVCRKAGKHLTCVDCFKDFLNEDYVNHTKCITEEERYAAKGTFPKGIVKKGDVKQESWMETVRSAIETASNVPPGQQQVMRVVSNSVSCVPRKKQKFINFITNSYGNKVSQKDIEGVWNIIEKYKNENSPPVDADEKLESKNEQVADGEGSCNVMTGDQEAKIKKKKKSKEAKEQSKTGDKALALGCDNNVENVETIQKKKKKSKQISGVADAALESSSADITEKKIEETGDVEVNGKTEVGNEKKKKKKSKNEEMDAEVNAEEESLRPTEEAKDDLKKKKRKSKSQQNNIENDMQNGNLNTEEPRKKKRKSKVLELSETQMQNTEETNHKTAEMEVKSKKRKMKLAATGNEASVKKQQKIENDTSAVSNCYFSFKDSILEVVRAKKSVSLEKLKKQVMKHYQECFGEELAVKAQGKFQKHLRKVEGIEVSDDTVRLIEN